MKLYELCKFVLQALCGAVLLPLAALATPLEALVTATYRPGILFSDFQYNWQIKAQAPEERFNDVEIQSASLANLDLSSYVGPGGTGAIQPAPAGNPNLLVLRLPANANSADGLYSSLNFSIRSVSNPTVVEGFPNVAVTRDGTEVGTSRARAPTNGTLATSAGRHIDGDQLRDWIAEFIPNESSRLLVLAQCFGGSMVSAFTGLANTAVASATSPGETAKFGGYDDDSAAALRPGGGIFGDRTAQTVHNAGVSGKHDTENPTTGGGLALGDFSLGNASATGTVQSRHVLVYAGQPDNRPILPANSRDDAIRDTIRANFAGQANTTVTTVGGNGTGGWDQPGTAAGLRAALQQIGNLINASPDPSKEQLIFYGGDHGDEDVIVRRAPMPVAPGAQAAFNGFPTFTTGDLDPQNLTNDPFNIPGFTAFVSFPDGVTYSVGDPLGYAPYFQPTDWRLEVDNGLGTHIVLNDFTEYYLELGDGIIGNQPGEGVQLFFPMDESMFVNGFFDVYADISILNNTLGTARAATYAVTEFDQDTGTVAKVLPAPATPALLIMGLMLLLPAVFPAARRRGKRPCLAAQA